MKKLLTNLLLVVLLNGFISAAPSTCRSLVNVSNLTKTNVSVNENVQEQEEEFEIHPLDILAFKFR